MNDIGFYTTQRRYRLERIIIFIFSTLAVITMYTFGETLPEMGEKLESSLAELSTIRKSIAKEKLPMVKGLNALEDDVIDVIANAIAAGSADIAEAVLVVDAETQFL